MTTRTLTGSKFDVINQSTFLTQSFNVTHAVRVVKNVACLNSLLSEGELVESLNDCFVSVASDIPPVDISSLPTFLPAAVSPPTIHPHEVCSKLLKLQTNKAMGPDSIPSRILKEFAYQLAEPVTSIFNTSLSSGLVPVLWKDFSIIPIPKAKQTQVESDTRPIALTPVLSKVLEDFVVS